jgi:outer membrane protein
MARLALFIVATLVTLLSTLARAADQQDLPKQLTLSQAITFALSNNSIVRAAQSRLDEASGRYEQSRSPLLPQLELDAHQSYQTINLIGLGIDIPTVPQGKTAPFASMDARLVLRQDLLNIANWDARKSSGSQQESFRVLVDNARELVVLDVVATYLQALRAKASRDALTEQKKLASDLYNLTEDRVKQGVSAPLESNRALQQVNALQQQQQEAEQSYIAAKFSLANALQQRITSDFEVEDTAAYGTDIPMTRDAALQAALTTRPDYRSLEANVKADELQVKSIKSYRIPTLTATFSDGQSGETPVHNVNTYTIRGDLNVPIFTGGRIRGQTDEAESALREAQTSLDKLRSQVETDVLTAMAGVEWALKEVETSATNVTLSRQEVELARQRFTQGVTDNTEVVNAQDRVSRADDARVRAMYTLGLARANLARATGAAEKTYRK